MSHYWDKDRLIEAGITTDYPKTLNGYVDGTAGEILKACEEYLATRPKR